MTSESSKAPAPHLAPELWAKVLKHLSTVDKASGAQVNRAAAAGCREAWTVADYFEAAGQPDKPERLRVAHGAAAPGDSKAWRALTREVRFGARDVLHEVPTDKPVKKLMALACFALWPSHSPHKEAEMWPSYAQALTAAGRFHEAAVFTGLIDQRRTMDAAFAEGDVATVQKLLRNRIPLPEGVLIEAAVVAYPNLAETAIQALVHEGDFNLISSLFMHPNNVVRDAVLACKQFRNPDRLLHMYKRCLAPPHNAPAALYLFNHCSPEEAAYILKWGNAAASTPDLQVICRLSPLGDDARRAILDTIVPAWLALGGDLTEVLQHSQSTPDAVLGDLVSYGACPRTALQRLASQKFKDDGNGHLPAIKRLLEYGARLDRSQFEAYVALHHGQEENFDKPYGFGRVLRLFEENRAVPLANGRFGDKFSASAFKASGSAGEAALAALTLGIGAAFLRKLSTI